MKKYDAIDLFLAGLAVVSFMIIVCMVVKDISYKKGQVDAITGEIKYELITNADSTRTWRLIKDK